MTNTGTQNGFTVDTESVRSAAAGFGACADGLGGVRRTIDGTPVPKEAFGTCAALAGDVESVIRSSMGRLGDLVGGLGGLVEKLDSSANAYDDTESGNQRTLTETGRA